MFDLKAVTNLVTPYHSHSLSITDLVIEAEAPQTMRKDERDEKVISFSLFNNGLEKTIFVERDSSLNGYRFITAPENLFTLKTVLLTLGFTRLTVCPRP